MNDTADRNGRPLLRAGLLAAGCVLVFAAIALNVAARGAITGWDAHLSELARSWRTPALTWLLWVFTVLGDTPVATLLATIVVALLALWGRRYEGALLGIAAAGGALLSSLAKLGFHRLRPGTALALIKTPASFSFPSGHAIYSTMFWGVLAFLVMRSRAARRTKIAAGTVAGLAILATGFSRIYLGVHWTSDVIASWALALAWLSACTAFYLVKRGDAPVPVRTDAKASKVRIALTAACVIVAVAGVIAGALADPLLH